MDETSDNLVVLITSIGIDYGVFLYLYIYPLVWKFRINFDRLSRN